LLLLAAALAASLLPAYGATKIDPILAIRQE
jgi:ABC-type antimicrobial peptide transport system permease subunit